MAISSCSTLGIATTDEMGQTQSRMDSLQRVNDARIVELQTSVAGMKDSEASMTTALQSLTQRLDLAKAYFDSLDLESIRSNLDQVNSRSNSVSTSYLTWLRNEHQFLDTEIKKLESQGGAKAAPEKQTDAPAADK